MKTAIGLGFSRKRTKVTIALFTATTALSLTACGGFVAQPVIKRSGCGTSSVSESDKDSAGLPGNTELKASGPITQPTRDGTTTFTSGFGPRWGTEHRGVDFAGPVGTPIYAALDGVAVKAGSSGEGPGVGFENWIVLDSIVDGKPVSTVYGHMFTDGVLIKEGQQVKAGDHIAAIGNAGGSTGPHLHFEYWEGGRLQGGTAIDPMTKLGGAPSPAGEPGGGAPAVQLAASSSSIDCAGFGVAGGGDLKAGSVPPEMEPWFRKAGSLCPQIKPSLLAADAKAESGLVRGLTSVSGAEGITQFMPGTFASYGQDDDGNGKISIHDDGDAIMAQGRYFCAIAAQVDGWIADGSVKGDPKSLYIASYNAGEGAVKNAGGMPSGGDYTTQTQPYVAKVLAYEAEFAAPGGSGELVVPPGSASGSQVVEAARQFLGTPYVWGGGNINGISGGGFDCSGLTSYAIYKGSGNKVALPRTSEQQWTVGVEIPIDQAQPGDLVFGSWESSGPGHVGIAMGNGRMVHAPTFGDVVKEAPLMDGMKARRVM
ncbi:peptidoglycan DD-metalloendopeptidase family protein [Rhodococcus sp. BH5]|uniref:peptidoglycan DD-metalloendopeptidase family protein n=1 Tax=Rhodococcus sp. BH5 TaxID=2871702 RepID=UPI0022CD685D|nr:peptidoglycan DD-metalloendopeptidase family protein [Rhodococcus sp. BH5]MCZ9635071.1 peptidoglycan DD-metalloendopeptidase family protein [Rhodococcus sp. BH5]